MWERTIPLSCFPSPLIFSFVFLFSFSLSHFLCTSSLSSWLGFANFGPLSSVCGGMCEGGRKEGEKKRVLRSRSCFGAVFDSSCLKCVCGDVWRWKGGRRRSGAAAERSSRTLTDDSARSTTIQELSFGDDVDQAVLSPRTPCTPNLKQRARIYSRWKEEECCGSVGLRRELPSSLPLCFLDLLLLCVVNW